MTQSTDSQQKKNYSSIPLVIIVHIALRNLSSKKLRSLLTLFGVIIGIGAIFFLLSFGLGLQNLVTDQVIGSTSVKSIDITSPNSKILKLDGTTVEKIKNLPNIDKAGLEFSFPGSMKKSGSELDAVVYGMNDDYQALSDFDIAAGRLIKNEDATVAIINDSARSALGFSSASDAVDQTLSMYILLNDASKTQNSIEKDFKIIGVVNSGAGSEVIVPSHLFETAGVEVYSQMKVTSDSEDHVAALREKIDSLGFQTSSPNDTIDQINQIFKLFNFALVGFGAIGMIVAVLGMFNTLTISLLERTKEIGLMIALGGRNRDMSKLFVFEATLLSVMGATAGIVFAILLSLVVNAFMNNFAHKRGVTDTFTIFSYPLWLIASLLAFMVLVGLLVAFFPAKRAQRIDPIDALRRE